jgi:hypothetical protein
MGQADSYETFRRFIATEWLGQIAIRVALGQRCAEDAEALGFQIYHARLQREMHILRDRTQALGSGPHAFCQCSVVVSGEHDPRASKILRGVEHPANGSVGDGLGIENVTSYQNRIALVFVGQSCKRFNGLEPGLDQGGTVLRFERGKCAAHLPVCRMQKLWHFIYLKDLEILALF